MEQFIEISLKLFAISAFRYFIIAGIPFFVFYKLLSSKFSKSKIQSKQASKKDFRREILHSMQSTAIMSVIAFLVLFTPVKNYTLVYTDLAAYGIWYIPLSIILSLIIHDTYFYWMHRLLHHPKLFKHTHLVHHKSVNPSPWTSYSFHFLEAIAEGLVLLFIVLFLPMSALSIGMFVLVGFMINVYGHLGYEIMPEWFRRSWLFEISNTSIHHNLHHSKFKGNYGLYFRFWDRLMGTEHPDYVKEYDRVQAQRFG
ncbi:sterol desaturase family protein [Pedobacter cryoconitis]|uniref:Sterol desaturase/sphingolipid hydroxylase (Fatty acid hydroxylase superfamily) n=1 Tax=Pedobacter cryoconitis TaxID=188932 RepID=A0A7X0MHW4_9SPHI|nr:sterol desaturase family protein [Pedobacter cryoconitis]MBB6499291.1 sterol desaturase/sphingolipid hydroxylase (fatty acid hydroxylase superfamily) [Pedobacter cryoconitis]